MEGKRILDLGCGAGSNAIALARAGAKVIAVDASAEQIAEARAAAERAEVKLEVHHAPLAELAFVRADTIDAVVSAYGLTGVADVDRVFRQVDRVLSPSATSCCRSPTRPGHGRPPGPRAPRAPQPTGTPPPWPTGTSPARSASLVHEPGPGQLPGRQHRRARTAANGPRSPGWTDAMRYVPATLVIRARKQGL